MPKSFVAARSKSASTPSQSRKSRLRLIASELVQVIQRYRPQVHAAQGAHPPCAGSPPLVRIRVAVLIKQRANKGRRLFDKRILAHQPQNGAIVLQQPLDQPEKPYVVSPDVNAAARDCDRKRKKPDEPV